MITKLLARQRMLLRKAKIDPYAQEIIREVLLRIDEKIPKKRNGY